MAPKSCVIAHFSPTGTTAAVARAIASGLNCRTREIDLSAPSFSPLVAEDELLIAAFPVYSGRLPALSRLSALKTAGQKAVAVAVYGNRAYDSALLELKDSLEGLGCTVVAAGAFIAEHSIIRSIAAGRPDEADKAAARAFGASIAEKLAREDFSTPNLPGDPSYRDSTPNAASFHPAGGDDCIYCGLCVKSCPMGAISPGSPTKTDGTKCINCMRCVTLCPKKTRSLPTPMLTAVDAMLQKTASAHREPEIFL